MTNAVKYTLVNGQVSVSASNSGPEVVVKVQDDGVGIPDDLGQATGMGLRIMYHRAGAIGATLNVGPAEGGGTIVACSLPRVVRQRGD